MAVQNGDPNYMAMGGDGDHGNPIADGGVPASVILTQPECEKVGGANEAEEDYYMTGSSDGNAPREIPSSAVDKNLFSPSRKSEEVATLVGPDDDQMLYCNTTPTMLETEEELQELNELIKLITGVDAGAFQTMDYGMLEGIFNCRQYLGPVSDACWAERENLVTSKDVEQYAAGKLSDNMNSPEVVNYYRDLKEKQLFCDAILVTSDNQRFPVHRLFLAARSPVLEKLFVAQPGCYSENVEIEVPTLDSVFMSALLDMIYSIKELSDMVAYDLADLMDDLILARKFAVSAFLAVGKEFVLRNLNPDNCLVFLMFYKENLQDFETTKDIAVFVKRRFYEVIETPEFLQLPFRILRKFLRDDDVVTGTEQEILVAVVRWILADKQARLKHVVPLLNGVRFGIMRALPLDRTITVNDLFERYPVLQDMDEWIEYKDLMPIQDIEFSPVLSNWRPRMPKFTLLTIGGWSNGDPCSLVEAYDYRADRWTTSNELRLPFARAYHGSVCVGTKLYVFGGYNRLFYNTTYALDLSKPEEGWEKLCGMVHARCYVSCVLDPEGYVWAIGGLDGQLRMSSVERYDINANQWERMPSMGDARSDCASVWLNGKIWVAGGFNGKEVLGTVECYDPESQTWTTMRRPMVHKRSGLSAVVYKGSMVVLGGFNGHDRVPAVESYDAEADAWVSLPDMLLSKSNFAATVVDDVIYTFGGYDGERAVPLVEVYNASVCKYSWVEIQRMPAPKSALGQVTVLGCLNRCGYVKVIEKLHQEDRGDRIKELENIAHFNTYMKHLPGRRPQGLHYMFAADEAENASGGEDEVD